eukprot:Hpha_TRINITY_DN16891_c0_g3::TRINITY_DN16891_c0_g3_i1::g.149297::m.149297
MRRPQTLYIAAFATAVATIFYVRRAKKNAPPPSSLSVRVAKALDELMLFLSREGPGIGGFDRDAGATKTVLTVSGNWYDPAKASAIASDYRADPSSVILVTGGLGRLSPSEADAVGGEPFLLRQRLLDLGVPAAKVLVSSAGAVTNHNLQAILLYAKQVFEFTGKKVRVRMYEEAYLVRRSAGSLSVMLDRDTEARVAVAGVQYVATGSTTLPELVQRHRWVEDVALALVVGEVERLRIYSTDAAPGGRPFVPPESLSGMPAGVQDVLDAMVPGTDAGDVLARGKKLLGKADRLELLRLAEPTWDS